MVIIDEGCSKCKHRYKELIDGWNLACEAYPKGVPVEICVKSDVRKLKERAPGFKWAPKDN